LRVGPEKTKGAIEAPQEEEKKKIYEISIIVESDTIIDPLPKKRQRIQVESINICA